ncbi:MAG: hypothetical protein ACI9ES_003380 [Oceanospirillaceae bacterium]|jgi:hypothetical protein
MGNPAKKLKRSKDKAKKERSRKANKKLIVTSDVAQIPDDLISSFEGLPPPCRDFITVKYINEIANHQAPARESDNREMIVAIFYAMYVHWYSTGNKEIQHQNMSFLAESFVKHPIFLKQLNAIQAR